jgi:hypothetical protein
MITHALLTRRRTLGVTALLLFAGLVLAACGGSSSGSTASSSAAAGGGAAAGGAAGGGAAGGGAGFAGRPGASGQVAAISGSTMQVQSAQAGQVAVTWTGTTKFTHPVTTSLAAVKAGDCVVATAPSGSTGSSFTAAALTVSSPVNGQCGAPGGGGQRPAGAPSGQRPSGFPAGGPGGANGAFANGTVSSVSGNTIVVAARQFGGNGSTTSRTVTVGSKTTISTQQATTSKSLKVGLCVNAQGSADSSGTVAATSVRITNPVNGQCSVGFGGRNGG